MSRILKRPMFRKGGEVMEGVMTGITPRKMYDEGSLNTADQGVVDNVRRKMNLIDVISGSGSSALGDPLTQFLLSTGQNLISGESAGGTKLQELAGATKQPLAQAIKSQQLKDLSKRKLATSLISKLKGTDIDMIKRNALALSKLKNIPYEEALKMEINKNYYKKGTSAEEQAYQSGKRIEDDLGKYKDFLRNPEYNPLQKTRIVNVITELNKNPELEAEVDISNPFISKDDYQKGTDMKTPDGEIRRVAIPDDKEDFEPDLKYFLVDMNAFFYYDAASNKLIEAK